LRSLVSAADDTVVGPPRGSGRNLFPAAAACGRINRDDEEL
jgi:hypothetical protein